MLESMSKLYSLKVDTLLKDTCHLLASIHRADIPFIEIHTQISINTSHQTFDDITSLRVGQSSLEKQDKLVVDKYNMEFDIDPLF